MKKKSIKIIFLTLLIILIIMPRNVISANKLMLGDVNNDKIINTNDLLLILRHISAKKSNKHNDWILKDEYFEAGDISKNEIIDSGDLIVLLRYIAANSDKESIGKKHPEWLVIEKKQDITPTPVPETKKETIINPTGINLTKTKTTINVGKREYIFANLSPVDAVDNNIEWTNSNHSAVAIEKIIENGTYYIKTVLNEQKVLEVANSSKADSAKIQLNDKDKNGKDNQKFEIINVGNGYYTIKLKHSGKVMDVRGGGKTKGTKIIQYKATGKDNQLWEFEYAGNGMYYIKSKSNGLYLDVNNSKAVNGAQLQVWTENKSKAQKYKLEQIEKKKKTIENGTYYIKTAINENKVLEVANSSNANSVKIQLNDKNQNGVDNQIFEIINIENGYYIIRLKHSGKAMDVKGGGKTKGTKIQQYNLNGTDAQIWKLESAGNGYYYFKPKCNDLYLDVKDGNAKNGTQLQVWTKNQTIAQKFKLEPIEKMSEYSKIGVAVIKAKNNGTATITAKTSNGKSSKCVVTTNRPVTSIKLNKKTITIKKGEKETLKATILPSNASNKSITWKSSNTKIATVSNKGVVTAKKDGTVKITAKSNNGKTATCNVTVKSTPDNLNGFLFVGDSITVGLSYSSLKTSYSNVVFRAVSGSTPSNWAGRNPYAPNSSGVPYSSKYNSYPANSSINGVVIMLGTNEVNLNKTEALNSMKILLTKLHNKYPNKILYVQKILPMHGIEKTSYNNNLKNICNSSTYKKYTKFIDATSGVAIGDGIHPTYSGYETLARNIRIQICGK